MFSFALLSQNSNATVLFVEEARIAAGFGEDDESRGLERGRAITGFGARNVGSNLAFVQEAMSRRERLHRPHRHRGHCQCLRN